MAEAEDVITDVARHATVWVRGHWRRHRPARTGPPQLALADIAERLDLLLLAAVGGGHALRPAQAALPPSLLQRLLRPGAGAHRMPAQARPQPLPATDGRSIWLPATLPAADAAAAQARYRVLALRQALLARRGAPAAWAAIAQPALADLLWCLEALSADAELVLSFPGTAAALRALRDDALRARPPPARWRGLPRALEANLRVLLAQPPGTVVDGLGPTASPSHSLALARQWLAAQASASAEAAAPGPLLWPDLWTGALLAPPPPLRQAGPASAAGDDAAHTGPPRAARLQRRPQVRQARDDEDDASPGAWMVQTAQPAETAADPMGLQRPTDRDTDTAAEDFADAVGELPEARLVAAPGKPKEVLLSDDPPERSTRGVPEAQPSGAAAFVDYPEWDWRSGGYVQPGARVHLLPCADGEVAWVQSMLARHAALLQPVRRRFEMLRAQRQRLRRQSDGDEIDIDAWCEAQADFRAGLPLAQNLYQTERPERRHLAISLLVDVSGSTDAWVSSGRRVIDVAREALLLVGVALDGLREPYAISAFSGQGPMGVVVRTLKGFDEPFGPAVQLRIAGLEPEHDTRVGAALRHASAQLMRQPARHRLLLLLSDGKPNDQDAYEGRYGVEDFRQAVAEARLQGISAFCLTIDRQAAGYLHRVFGPQHSALLRDPERLPAALLGWMRRLVSS
jgi:nitric oxide reductase NorD protein